MAFRYIDTYAVEFAEKRKTSANYQKFRQITTNPSVSINIDKYNTSLSNIQSIESDITSTQTSITSVQALLTRAQQQGNTELAANLQQQLISLQNHLADSNARLQRTRENIAVLEAAVIKSVVDTNADLNGKSSQNSATAIYAKFKAAQQFNHNISPLDFAYSSLKPTGQESVATKINAAAKAANRFRNIVQGRPDNTQAVIQARDPFAIFDPAVCGLIALDNEGSIRSDTIFNIPFMYIWDIKEGKSSSYESVTPMGRFESHRAYSGGEPQSITMTLGYYAFDSGSQSDEGFIRETVDRLLATQYPIYGKNQQNGVRSYGSPNKYLLNIFSRIINVPVYIENVSIDEEYAHDPQTWLPMGFKLTLECKTAYRLAQVISAQDIVTKGLKTFSHKFI